MAVQEQVRAQVERRPFTVAEYDRMAEIGLLGEDERIELIEGDIVRMSPIGARHAACVKYLSRSLNRQIGATTIISVQDPIHLNALSEPQPDVAVLRERADYYASAHPMPADVLLLVEVAETSLDYDRFRKLPLYASAGIPEVWLVDLVHETITVYARPADGAYGEANEYRRGDRLVSTALPGLDLEAAEILGEPPQDPAAPGQP